MRITKTNRRVAPDELLAHISVRNVFPSAASGASHCSHAARPPAPTRQEAEGSTRRRQPSGASLLSLFRFCNSKNPFSKQQNSTYPCMMAKFIIYRRAARSLLTPAALHSLSLETLNLSTDAMSISETFPRKYLRRGFELTRYRL